MTKEEVFEKFQETVLECINAVNDATVCYSSKVKSATYTALLISEMSSDEYDDEQREEIAKMIVNKVPIIEKVEDNDPE